MQKLKKLFYNDETEKYVAGQPPNVPVYIAVVGGLGTLFSPDGIVSDLFGLVLFGAACTWGYLEIRYGKSIFRRTLGVLVLVLVFVSRLT